MENQQSQDQTQDPNMPTAEQIAASKLQRAAMVAFYKEDMKNLEIEAKYNELQERVEKARFNTWQWRIRFDQMMAPPPQQEGPPVNKGEERKEEAPEKKEALDTIVSSIDNGEKGNVVPLTTAKTEEPQN